jgi:hypothetical protein
VKKEYVELRNSGHPHNEKVGFYALHALNKLDKETKLYFKEKYNLQ